MDEELYYPWQQLSWQHLVQRYRNGQLPHAVLFTGAEGLGKLHLAQSFARWSLCSQNYNPQEIRDFQPPCGQCKPCQLMKAGTHPDYLEVLPEAEGKQIPIDTIRSMSQFLSLKSQYAPLQIVVISPAEAMNKFAANSLLKTLEEPTPGSLLILVSSQPSRLLPTIRSRCQSMQFRIPERELALRWLAEKLSERKAQAPQSRLEELMALAAGTPLLALKCAEEETLDSYQKLLASFEKLARKQADPLAEVKLWQNVGLGKSVKWIYLWVSAMIHLKSQTAQVDTKSEWLAPSLRELAGQISYQQLFQYLDKVTECMRFVNTQVNVQLTLEDLLTSWRELKAYQ